MTAFVASSTPDRYGAEPAQDQMGEGGLIIGEIRIDKDGRMWLSGSCDGVYAEVEIPPESQFGMLVLNSRARARGVQADDYIIQGDTGEDIHIPLVKKEAPDAVVDEELPTAVQAVREESVEAPEGDTDRERDSEG